MPPDRNHVRCAIYTRKSSEEGLEQEFNSLHAQREACEAFIVSQRHEGWKALPDLYDDGGFSGGSMERPGLRQLLADIDAGKVHVVVVYKVDRLTRALADFAKIVEAFDAKGVSFVSVTQQFNTTTSMGRLTLNVLLSFAQFEREVTGERIRDKIAASKKKGMWMGGNPPLGYDVRDRKLVVSTPEAEIVRHIFTRYADLGSVRELKVDLDRDGIVSKVRTSKTGNVSGGKSLSRGALYKMLSNRIYVGEIVHKDQFYPGEHDAIVSSDLWERVQTVLNDNAVERRAGINAKDPSLLTGLVFDDTGNPLTPSHANKRGVRYRYYVSVRDTCASSIRLPGREFEDLVTGQVAGLLQDPTRLFEVIPEGDGDVAARRALLERAKVVATRIGTDEHVARKNVVHGIVSRIDVGREAISLSIDRGGLANLLLVDGYWAAPHSEDSIFLVSCPYRIKRRGVETRLIVSNEKIDRPARPDASLMRAVAKAFVWNRRIVTGDVNSMADIIREEGVASRYVRKLLPLAHLAPDIVEAICAGHQPPDLNLETLVYTDLPNDWSDQRRKFGFNPKLDDVSIS
ncbi:MAG: recombinase family protein [Rhodospirillales bacterium]|nr:recombinase family protein [Rhodospirillales bacterium]